MQKDYYSILGISKNATQDEIKKAFRQLSLQYHPDKNPEGADKFKEINEAYQTLSNQNEKLKYDLRNNGGGGGSWTDFFSETDNIFSGFGFSDASFEQREQISPLHAKVYTTIKDSAFGCKKTVKIKRRTLCDVCFQTRATCGSCGGKGYITNVKTNGFFSVQEKTSCSNCSGTGFVYKKNNDCSSACNDGFILTDWDLNVELPRGFPNNTQYVIKNVGHESSRNKGFRGDVILRIMEHPEDNHEREGNDILYTDNVKYVDLALGAKRTIHLFGDQNHPYTYEIPKWYDSDKFIKIADGPLPHGATYVRVKLKIPKRDLKQEHIDVLKRICEE